MDMVPLKISIAAMSLFLLGVWLLCLVPGRKLLARAHLPEMKASVASMDFLLLPPLELVFVRGLPWSRLHWKVINRVSTLRNSAHLDLLPDPKVGNCWDQTWEQHRQKQWCLVG